MLALKIRRKIIENKDKLLYNLKWRTLVERNQNINELEICVTIK